METPISAVKQLLGVDSAENFRSIVEKTPQLLDDSVFAILARLAGEVDGAELFIVNRALQSLTELRAVGINADLTNVDWGQSSSDSLFDADESLLSATDGETIKNTVDEYPDLLGQKIESLLLDMVEDGSNYSSDRSRAILNFLATYRAGQPAAAASAFDREFHEVETASQIISSFLFIKDAEEAARYLNDHPVLLGKQAEAGFVQTAGMDGADGDALVAEFFRNAARNVNMARQRRIMKRPNG